MPFNDAEWRSLREKIIGLGESSIRKSYYPELQKRLDELERFRSLLDETNDAIFLLEIPSGRFADLNKAVSKHLGYSAKQLLNMSMEDLVVSTDKNRLKQLFKDMVEGGTSKGRQNIVTHLKNVSGREIPFEISVTVVNFSDALYMVMVARDITERKESEDQIRASLDEKNVLLQEIHHRVKNNMQIISSLLSLQSRYVTDEDALEVFKESQNRVKSMAMIHEKLYMSRNFTKINFGEYIKNLTTYLFQSYVVDSESVKLVVDVEDVTFGIDTAIPCGLIINEIVTNSIKYAFPEDRVGEITIKLWAEDKTILLEISDDGVGVPDDFSIVETKTLGLQLVATLVKQLEGTIELMPQEGTKFRISFEELRYKRRI
ncbi:sensor histidine kinase [Methanobacterium aggregans]|uniref:sensor histidine kinase n=1 Tax=Methanobacterium aggregans TaxID=1615586 RepID=UPI003210FA4A